MSLPFVASRKNGLFVTATDTGVGKTLVAGGIASLLVKRGLKVGVFKPIATGCIRASWGLESQDACFLAQCADADYPLTTVTPVTYETPAAPLVAAEAEKRPIDFELIAETYQYLCKICDVVIVEGIGGVRVPLTEQYDVRDLAAAFGLPVVIVARPHLGTINHTLLTVDSLRAKGIEPAGIVVNAYSEPLADRAVITAPDVISRVGKVKILALCGHDETASVEGMQLGMQVPAGLSACDWTALMTLSPGQARP
jgi:dethiobiotin synthetase